MSEEEWIGRLKSLGLNLYESRAYFALLNSGRLTAKGVGQSSLIPQSRTYDILVSLTRKGLAQATPSSPPTYVPVPPAKALASYMESRRKGIRERAVRAQEEAQARLEVMDDSYRALAKEFPGTDAKGQVAPDRVWVLQTRDSIESTLVGFIKDAKSYVFRITKPPKPESQQPFDPFYIVGMENQRFLYEALERNVEMKWITLSREIPTFSGLNVSDAPERRYFDREEDISEKFLLVDNSSALLNLRNPLSSTYGYVALAIQSEAVTSIFLDHFEKLWKKGTPLARILPKMKELVAEVCTGLGEAGLGKTDVAAYRTLAQLGAIDQGLLIREMAKKKFRSQDVATACDRLARLGLIHRQRGLRVLLVEHPKTIKSMLANGKLKAPA